MKNNLDILFEGVDRQTLEDVEALFRADAVREAAAAAAMQTAIGRRNREDHGSVDGLGAVTRRYSLTDRFGLPALFGAEPNDPDFWKWIEKQPDAEYAKVTRPGGNPTVRNAWEGRRVRFFKRY